MVVIASLLILVYLFFTGFVLRNTYLGRPVYILLYVTCFLPFYTIFQIIILNAFDNVFLVNLIKYSKDFVFISSFLVFVFGVNKAFFQKTYSFTLFDKMIISFMLLTIVYLIIPLGEATFISKIIYSKNIFLIGIIYFFGRKTMFNPNSWKTILNILIGLIIISFLVAFIENTLGVHLHSLIGYADYHMVVNDIDPQGNFGLSWSFESQGAIPRYAGFFADPLEFSASLILFFSITLWHFIHSKISRNRIIYFGLILVVIFSFSFASSRASMIASVLVLIFALFISKNYKILFIGFSVLIFSLAYLFFYASEETRYLFQDTLTFQNSSSIGHLFEWIQGILSIYENPFGVGLAMSGNASGVDQSIKIGGENQFLIYGVQMGVIAIALYLLILIKSIWNSIKLYTKSSNLNHKSIGFISGLTKLGLLVPLFTANAELYLFVAFFSWYLVGQVETLNNSDELIKE